MDAQLGKLDSNGPGATAKPEPRIGSRPKTTTVTIDSSTMVGEAEALHDGAAPNVTSSIKSAPEGSMTAADNNGNFDQEQESQTKASEAEEDSDINENNAPLERQQTRAREFWKFRMRPPDDDEPEDWWFASTAIPLIAATTGPLANVLSIAALVVSWRVKYRSLESQQAHLEVDVDRIEDPTWCLALNGVSLACGFVGNAFLLANFTRRIRYIIALPCTIFFWYLATTILITITACMDRFAAPNAAKGQLYSQGFWHAIIAATLYLVSAMALMMNMLGYFLGHYTQHFDLTEEQRNLILQTMMFFIWLAGGAGVFSRVCDWSYVDALYFCDVTILTVGFGDFYATNDVGRGLVFPYSVGGIIILGLMVSSIQKFAKELGHDKVVMNQVETRRLRTIERSVGSTSEAEKRDTIENSAARTQLEQGLKPAISRPFNPERRTIKFGHETDADAKRSASRKSEERDTSKPQPLRQRMTWSSNRKKSGRGLRRIMSRTTRLLILREEKDRFEAMRAIQYSTRRFKRYFALTMSVIAFGLLWCVGAMGFWKAEAETQGLSYFQALYFCYVSLLTIGYGDLSPKSNAGKPFFIVWSLIAVPTMTILISDMSETVVASYKRGTFKLADWTVLTRVGFFREYRLRHPKVFNSIDNWRTTRASRKRLEAGFLTGPERPPSDQEIPDPNTPTLEQLAENNLDDHALARRLTNAIRRTADHLKHQDRKRYTYEEWAEYTRLIRFSRNHEPGEERGWDEGEKGIVDWDWIGPNSPMMSDQSEAEWVLDRLCESMERYVRKQVPEEGRGEWGEE
ncbi:MAG: Potassium channel [Stictis urceolatum]|nr:Potassium channel [Stictis urceolata]